MFRFRLILMTATIALAGCSQPPDSSTAPAASDSAATPPAVEAARENPFFQASSLPFQAPPFDRIQIGDYQPAMEKGMAEQQAEWKAIADDPAAPTFDNTFVPLEKSGALLTRTMAVFNAVAGADTNAELQQLEEAMAPKLAAHRDTLYLDEKIFGRVQAIHDALDQLDLDAEARRLVEVTHQEFVLHGAQLDADGQAKLKTLNERASTLETQFSNRLLAAANDAALLLDSAAKLAGMSPEETAAAAEAAAGRGQKDKWLLVLQNTTQQPALADLADRDTRKALFEASWSRAERGDANDTRALIEELAEIRADEARLLGFDDYAAWKLQDQMAKTPQTVMSFLGQLAPAAVARARREGADIQAQIDSDQKAAGAKPFELEPWDWLRFGEEVRKAKYAIDASELRPYFELDRVLQDGVFYAAGQLYGLSFKERKDIPVYHPDVRVFDVIDRDGQPLGLFYCDYFKRDSKNGGAWMDNFVQQSRLLGTQPVIYNVGNFTKPAAGQPALISFDDVITMFHEFGHALHGFFADQEYPSLSGTNTARDFVEFPSQFNEYWATEPSVFAHYARHYQTGEPMPQELVDKMRAAERFNKGYDMTELVAAALLDMNWHMLTADEPRQHTDAFEAAALKKDGVDLSTVPPRYRSSYFLHIWNQGYAAGYYAYLWTQMLADDAFEDFKEHGGMNAKNGQRFRDMLLSRGNTEDLAAAYRAWRGKAPAIEPMLINRGLK